MSRSVAISVGVSRVPTFPYLPGALAGARQFASWAEEQLFDDVHLLVDEPDTVTSGGADGVVEAVPVTARNIFTIVKEAVKAGDVVRLFVFFAGHGLAAGYGEDLWLLSDALDDDSEAVNVLASHHRAQWSGIKHVALFADACRTARSGRTLSIEGRSIFPSPSFPSPTGNVRAQVDQFYACVPGDPAWERRPDDPGHPPYGIYTKCLMGALEGREARAVAVVEDGLAPSAVLARSLADYLDWAVPRIAQREVRKRQLPDSSPASYWKPNVLAWIDEAHLVPAPEPDGEPGPLVEEDSAIPPQIGGGDMPPAGPPEVVTSSVVSNDYRKNEEAVGRDHFETGTGLTVVGSVIMDALVAGAPGDVFEDDQQWHVRGDADIAAGAALRIAPVMGSDVTWVATAVLPGFVGTVRVDEHGAQHVGYLPVGRAADSQRLTYAETHAAQAAAGALAGVWRLDHAPQNVRVAGLDDLNPTVAVLMAYQYDRRGRDDELRSLLAAFEARDRIVPFDLALLAAPDDVFAFTTVAPAFPLMTRGWVMLAESDYGELSELAKRVLPHLAPSRWTTLFDIDDDLIQWLISSPIELSS